MIINIRLVASCWFLPPFTLNVDTSAIPTKLHGVWTH